MEKLSKLHSFDKQ